MTVFSTFNPSIMPPHLLEGAFVQREALAARLVDIFEESAFSESKHNVLLVGPRGIGKSHLVSLVYHRLEEKKNLADKLCIAYLKEDEWGINSFLDLLVSIVQAVREDGDTKLKETLSTIIRHDSSQAEEIVWKQLEKVLGTRTLLLIVENLDAIFDKIGEQGQQRWRALMQTFPKWAVLATTPALFSGISRQVSPFYGFFEVIYLQPLSFVDAVHLLQHLARLNKDEDTADFLETPIGRARIKAVRHLAGGNHRIFVLFYDFLSQSGSQHFLSPLIKTVDALTPYYQSQMSRLSPQQQKITSYLCERQSPATVTEIAQQCLISPQTAASQLKQLLSNHYVRVNRVGRESFYELAEPLLRICVEAKAHDGRPLDLLVDFMRYWFSREELEKKLTNIDDSHLERTYFTAALKEYDDQGAHSHLTPEISSLCAAVRRRAAPAEKLREQAQELAELSKIAEDWSHYARAMAELRMTPEAIKVLEEVLNREPRNDSVLRSLGWMHFLADSFTRAEELFDRAIEANPSDGFLFLDKGQLLRRTKRQEEALESFKKAALLDRSLKVDAAVEQARTLIDLERFDAARESLLPFLSRAESIDSCFVMYGMTLAGERRFEDALGFYRKAIHVNEHDSLAWANMGIVLSHLHRYEEAIEPLNRGLASDDDLGNIAHYRCQALLHTKKYQVAVETASPETLSHNLFHQMLDIMNSQPNQTGLDKHLNELREAHNSQPWQLAFCGGLTEFANFAKDFNSQEDLERLQMWNLAVQHQFGHQEGLAIVAKLFDVLARFKLQDDRKALLELPLEQRLLLMDRKGEEELFNRKDG